MGLVDSICSSRSIVLLQVRLPWVNSRQFDFHYQPAIDRQPVRELAGLSFVERTQNVAPPSLAAPHRYRRP
jgi:hypothetical protein